MSAGSALVLPRYKRVVALYRNEPASVPVQQFLSALTEPVRISSLTKVELASALARVVRMRELDEPGALQISKLLEQDLRNR